MQEFLAQPCTTDRYHLGESCRFDEVREELYWVDIPTGRFFRATADATSIEIVRTYDLYGDVSAVAPMQDRSEGWMVAINQSLCVLSEAGQLREVARPEGHNGTRVRMNDGAADQWGRFWIGSMAYDEGAGQASLYRFHQSTGVELIFSSVTISNGIGWSPDQHTMYYADSAPGTIHSFEVDERGDITNKRLLVQFDVARKESPDGLCVDRNGSLWVAVWGGYEVRQFSPSGEQLARVRLDTAQPSSCAIGGSNATTLYVTTARHNMSAESLADQPNAGRLFCVDVHVQGQHIETYRPILRAMA